MNIGNISFNGMLLKLSRIRHAKTIKDDGDGKLAELVFVVHTTSSLRLLTTMPKPKQILQTPSEDFWL
jgi:hypothetical protein